MELKGKIIDFLGDSITEGHSVEDIPNNRYDNVLKRLCGLKEVYNYGIGGTRIAHQIKPSEKARWDLNFCGRAYDLYPEADIIVVYGGVNDYYHGDAPFGEVGDKTRETFCGCVDFLLGFLHETYPKAEIVFMTPAHCLNDAEPSASLNKTVPGYPLIKYIRAIEAIAAIHNVPVLNLYEKLPIDPNDPADCRMYTAEGLHFNDAGHRIIAETLKKFLEEL